MILSTLRKSKAYEYQFCYITLLLTDLSIKFYGLINRIVKHLKKYHARSVFVVFMFVFLISSDTKGQTACPNYPSTINTCVTPATMKLVDLEGDGIVDLRVDADQNSGYIEFNQAYNWLSAGSMIGGNFFYTAFPTGTTVNGSNVNAILDFGANNVCGASFDWYGYFDFDGNNNNNNFTNGQWNGQTGAPGLFAVFKKDGVLGFIEILYNDQANPNTFSIGSYGLSSSSASTCIIVGNCNSLVNSCNTTPPPSNDNCNTAMVLDVKECCIPLTVTNIGATISTDTPGYSCQNTSGKDV